MEMSWCNMLKYSSKVWWYFYFPLLFQLYATLFEPTTFQSKYCSFYFSCWTDLVTGYDEDSGIM